MHIGSYFALPTYRRIQSYYRQSRRREKCPRSSAMQTIPVPLASKHPNQKINKRNRKDSAHVSQIIHEIMNQLTVIGFCNHQLRDLLAGNLDEAQPNQFEIIARAVNTTAELAAKLNTNIKNPAPITKDTLSNSTNNVPPGNTTSLIFSRPTRPR